MILYCEKREHIFATSSLLKYTWPHTSLWHLSDTCLLSYFPVRCAIIYDVPDSLTQTVQCRGMEGRFINFYLSCATERALLLCEVKVYGGRNPVYHYMSSVVESSKEQVICYFCMSHMNYFM